MDEFLIARFVHIFFAVLWFGLTISAGQKAAMFKDYHADQAFDMSQYPLRHAIFANVFSIGTIGTGWWLVELTDGWPDAPVTIHIGATLALILYVIGAFPYRLNWKKLAKLVSENAAKGDVASICDNIALWSRIAQALWIGILFTMVFRHSF